jgi:hypothetical protein
VCARTGDTDGANLPWFEFADAILLFWWIHKDAVSLPITAIWSSSEAEGVHKLNLQFGDWESILAIEVNGNGTSITASVPQSPLSASPSWTYPLRVGIIHVVAPTTILLIGLASLFSALGLVFLWVWCGFVIMALVVSFWRLLGGPSIEDCIQTVQDRLERWNQDERLRVLRLGAVQEGVDRVYHNERVKTVIRVCRHGWHPEREGERERATEEADIEKPTSSK